MQLQFEPSQCSIWPGRQNGGESRRQYIPLTEELNVKDDILLQQRISDELMFEPRINPAHIGISVRDGVATLSGHVESYAEKQEAEAAVRRVKGVKAIAQELTVLPPTAHQTEDDQIASRALKMLAWDVMVPGGRISVSVEHGIATLEGEVDWQYQRAAAEADLCKLGGVKAVVNKIAVHPSVSANDIHMNIRAALERHAEIEASQVRIRVDGDKVTLSGKAHSDTVRREIERAAWSTAGVSHVHDHIVVA
jgi:osmotically-inducible protein OsmY